MPSKLRKAIGAVKDQTSISLAKVSNNQSSNVEVIVLKATTHEDVPIEERYVNEVLHLVSSNKVYAAVCARALGKRISRTRNWIVALKSLMLVLRLFQDGDPYFPREVLHAMKRGAKILNLSSFRDDSNSSPWDYTAFVRTFALYLDERLDCFLTGKLQRRYTNKDRDSNLVPNRGSGRRGNEPVRDMKSSMLLDRISYWQRLLERAIGTRPTGVAKTNRLVQICLYAVVQESFDLYRDISDGIALILDSYFYLPYHSCVIAFQTCLKAAKQFEELGAFYSLCKSIGVGRTSEYPSIEMISEELIESLQEFLKDQASFPARSPARPVELRETGSSSGGRDNEGSENSGTSTERYSETQSTSLEDLIRATECGRHLHNISIDLEDYSDQFEKKSHRDDTFRMSDTGSTHSLPASNSMADLVSLDDWPETQECVEENKKKEATGWDLVLAEVITQWPPPVSSTKSQPVQGQEKKDNEADVTSSNTSWDLVLADNNTSSWNPQTNDVFNDFEPSANKSSQPVQEEKSAEAQSGWELVLAETATQWTQQTPNASNSFDVSSLDSSYNQVADSQPVQGQEKNDNEMAITSSGPSWDIVLADNNTSSWNPQTSSSGPSWDLVLADNNTSSWNPQTPGFFNDFEPSGNAISQPVQTDKNEVAQSGWELVLAETATQWTQQTPNTSNTFDMSSLDSSFNQITPLPTSNTFGAPSADNFYNQSPLSSHHYNPFLQEPIEIPAMPMPVTTSTAMDFNAAFLTPTFQATPTFSAQNLNDQFGSSNENDPFKDPFGSFGNDQTFNGSANQQSLLQEQQLWLEQQNKIIGKRMS